MPGAADVQFHLGTELETGVEYLVQLSPDAGQLLYLQPIRQSVEAHHCNNTRTRWSWVRHTFHFDRICFETLHVQQSTITQREKYNEFFESFPKLVQF